MNPILLSLDECRDEDVEEGDIRHDDQHEWRNLVRLAQLGGQDAFEELYVRSARWLLTRIRRIVTDGNAEDVLAETYIQVWRTIASYDEKRASPAGWLAMIARSRALDHLRAQRSRGPCIAVDEDEFTELAAEDDPQELYARDCDKKILHQCVHSLEGTERLIVSLAYFSGYTLEEISQTMDQPIAAIKGRLTQARRKLKVLLASTSLGTVHSAGQPQ